MDRPHSRTGRRRRRKMPRSVNKLLRRFQRPHDARSPRQRLECLAGQQDKAVVEEEEKDRNRNLACVPAVLVEEKAMVLPLVEAKAATADRLNDKKRPLSMIIDTSNGGGIAPLCWLGRCMYELGLFQSSDLLATGSATSRSFD